MDSLQYGQCVCVCVCVCVRVCVRVLECVYAAVYSICMCIYESPLAGLQGSSP